MRIRGLGPTNLVKLALAAAPKWERVQHVFICIADHYEPKWGQPTSSVARDRVMRWRNDYPRLTAGIEDCRACPPQHTFFYPEEEYEPQLLEPLAELCRLGLGDVEVHLHHDQDTADGVREKIERFTATLHQQHGLLRRDALGRLAYAFIHGNWALDNSRPDGRWCGVNNEISILIETGCYADLTMPAAPDPCQTSTINQIYYAVDDPARPKSHDQGAAAAVGVVRPPNSLLMIQGPLAADWGQRKWGLIPRLETGDLTPVRPPTLDRLHLWRKAGVSVRGREDWLFVKLHTHGAQEGNANMLLGEPMRRFHESLRDLASRQPLFRYYYVTARELAALVNQAETGMDAPSFAANGL